MASYFDLPPQKNAAVASIEQVPKEQRSRLGQMSLLSPAVTQLLDDLGEERSDSDSEEGSLSDHEEVTGNKDSEKPAHIRASRPQDKQKLYPQTPPVPSSLSPRRSSPKSSPNKGSKHGKTTGGGGESVKTKHPHMARLHSLRSMLFSANLEDKMKSVQQEDHEREEAADQWKSQHERRQMHRPKTPEKDAPANDGIRSRLKIGIRRITTKDVPTMESIGEDGALVKFEDRVSTASSDSEYEDQEASWKPRDPDEESINHSDVEDLVRWVSRRDPPSDGEARKERTVPEIKEDSGHESLGNSDVDELVRYASRRSDGKREEEILTGYSDASTESDSEMARHSSEEEEDADDLVRWISQREGSQAGPVRRNLDRREPDSEADRHYDSDVPELGRWVKRNEEASGDTGFTAPVHEEMDELTDEPERGRPRSRSESPIVKEPKSHLRSDDIPELVRWVSRKDVKQQDPIVPDTDDAKSMQPSEPAPLRPNELESGDLRTLRSTQPDDDDVEQIGRDEDSKKEQLGTTVRQLDGLGKSHEERTGSLGNEDVDELVRWVSKKSL
ncbi:hypothetical protein N0V83_004621 [Neocucurbitaria cava]|uniref:Uncharacterized protein n=1 Tax=Neocucurbitaria cava TaxID=798079 RepID=A0A9W8YA32_9PLEO|nr:hypothetical protein N0V83_004621 [Neocucurbitaria cava]